MTPKEIEEKPESLNLDELRKSLIIKAFKTYPFCTDPEISSLLGISERTLYRDLKHYNLDKTELRALPNKKIESAARMLRMNGFIIKRKKSDIDGNT